VSDLHYQKALLIAEKTGLDINDLLIFKDLFNREKAKFEDEIQKLENGYPLDYLLGKTTIAGKEFQITENTLIPRPETEIWIKNIKNKTQKFLKKYQYKNLNLVDLGTGTGVIGISLADSFANTFLIDKSKKALKIAKINSEKNRKIQTFRANIFDNKKLLQKMKTRNYVLISNPPYLPQTDYKKEFEPLISLYSGHNGLKLFTQILQDLQKLPKKPVLVWFELDPRNIQKARKLLQKIYKKTKITTDDYGRKRNLIGYL
jgi:release factor glutamine methyltransferase